MNNSTVVFPLPLDIVRPFVEALGSVARDAPAARRGRESSRAVRGPSSPSAAGAALRSGADQPVAAGTPVS